MGGLMFLSFDFSVLIAFYGAFVGVYGLLWVAKNILFTIKFS